MTIDCNRKVELGSALEVDRVRYADPCEKLPRVEAVRKYATDATIEVELHPWWIDGGGSDRDFGVNEPPHAD